MGGVQIGDSFEGLGGLGWDWGGLRLEGFVNIKFPKEHYQYQPM